MVDHRVGLYDGRVVDDLSAPLEDLLDALVVLGDCLATATDERGDLDATVEHYKGEIIRRFAETMPGGGAEGGGS